MSYHLPTTTDWVTCSWQCHKDRNPPSSMPGTDYGSAYGSPLYAVGSGTVTVANHSTAGGNGRHVGIRLDDGRETWSLHLDQIWVGVGQRVTRGQEIGRTGASGFGSDWGYGAHVHQTLWDGPAWSGQTIDFALYVGEDTPDPPPPPPEDEEAIMAHVVMYTNSGSDEDRKGAIVDIQTGFVQRFGWFPPSYADGIAKDLGATQAAPVTPGQFDGILRDLAAFNEARGPEAPPGDPAATTTLTGPAWVIGAILGLIGLVEVIRLVVDLIV